MAPASPPTFGRAPTLTVLGAILAVDAAIGLVHHPALQVGTRWSAFGLALGLLARSPRRRWWWQAGIVAIAFAALHLDRSPTDLALLVGAFVVQLLVGTALLSRWGRGARLDTFNDLLRLILVSTLCGALATGAQVLLGSRGLAHDRSAELAGLLSHSTGTLCLAALVLVVGHRPAYRRVTPEAVLQIATVMVMVALVLTPGTILPLSFVPIPFLVWAALRFDLSVVVWELSVFTFVMTAATAQGYGPFALSIGVGGVTEVQVGLLVQAYLAAATMVSLPVAVGKRIRDQLVERMTADEERFRRNFTQSPLGMVFLRAQGGHLVLEEMNTSAEAILGASASALAGRQLRDVLDTHLPFERVEDSLLDGSEDAWYGQGAVLGRLGSRVEVALATLVQQGKERVFALQLLDLTHEKDAQRRLEAAYKLNDATLDTAACIILVADERGTVRRVNAATRRITGFTEGDLIGRPVWDCGITTLERSEIEAMFLWPNRSGYPIVAERAGRTADGSPLRIVWNNNVVRDEHGLPSFAVLTGVDVTAERSSAGLAAHLLQASVSTALIGVDVAGRITVFNSGAEHLLGYEAADVVGEPFTELLDPAELVERTGASGRAEAFTCLVGTVDDRGESAARDWTWVTRDGDPVIVSMTLSMTDDEIEDRVFLLAIGRDVTAQRVGQRTLLAALEKERTAVHQLSRLDSAKDEFVSTVSHELRTPVTSILGYAEMLLDGSITEPSPDQVPMLESISRNGERLVAICNDLLTLRGLESAPSLTLDDVDLREALALAEDSLRALAHDRNLDVRVHSSAHPVRVLGDRAQLDRVLLNLVSNAVKFTDDGGEILVGVENDGGEAVLTVSDSGIGIAAVDQEAVFDRFFRTPIAQTRAIPGTGLGLAIVQGIVAAHGGRIELQSEVGVGTTFRVRIPVLTPAEQELTGS